MANQYLQQTSTLCAVMPGIIPPQQQVQNQLSAIITDITNLYNATNGLLGNGSTGSSWFQSQNVVTGLRALGTIYQNTTGHTMFVMVTNNVGNSSSVIVYSDSTLSPTTEVGATNTQSTLNVLSFMVLNNNYYTLTTTGTVSLIAWTEWS